MLRKLLRSRKGQGMVEYAMLVAGVSLAAIVGVSLMGEKTGDMIAAVATVLPGADSDDNAPVTVGHLIETSSGSATAPIQIDLSDIMSNSGSSRLSTNLGDGTSGTAYGNGNLIVDPVPGN